MKTIETWFLWLMIYSIIGWVYESTICSIGHRKLINRGFLNGPYCPIYGTGAVLVLLVLGRIQNPVLLFFAGALVTLWGDRIFEKCGIGRDEGGDGGKTLEIRGKRRLSARDGGANYQQS